MTQVAKVLTKTTVAEPSVSLKDSAVANWKNHKVQVIGSALLTAGLVTTTVALHVVGAQIGAIIGLAAAALLALAAFLKSTFAQPRVTTAPVATPALAQKAETAVEIKESYAQKVKNLFNRAVGFVKAHPVAFGTAAVLAGGYKAYSMYTALDPMGMSPKSPFYAQHFANTAKCAASPAPTLLQDPRQWAKTALYNLKTDPVATAAVTAGTVSAKAMYSSTTEAVGTVFKATQPVRAQIYAEPVTATATAAATLLVGRKIAPSVINARNVALGATAISTGATGLLATVNLLGKAGHGIADYFGINGASVSRLVNKTKADLLPGNATHDQNVTSANATLPSVNATVNLTDANATNSSVNVTAK